MTAPAGAGSDLPEAERERRERFAALQREHLEAAWEAARIGSGLPHVTVALPSFSLDASVYEHYGTRLPPLENRFLHCVLLAARPEAHVVFLSSLPVPPDVLEGYLALLPEARRAEARSRLHLVPADDPVPGSLARKLLARPDLVAEVRRLVAGRGPGLVEAWNVTEPERDLALALGLPMLGTPPELRGLATKSNGRRLMRGAGVPVPAGVEDVSDTAALLQAVHLLRGHGHGRDGFVAKLDDSVAGDGNVCLPADVAETGLAALLPEWWLGALAGGGIVEERISGTDFRSPSCQAVIEPDGGVTVLATHEQRLGGEDGHVYEGCSFPADTAYAAELARHTEAAGQALSEAGALGRFAVDFVVCRHDSGGWQIAAVEINLRKGGTTHPYGLTRLLTGARYDATTATMRDDDGRAYCYASTDNLIDPAWTTRGPAEVHRRLARSGVQWDPERRRGVVPHLLDCLAVDGRMGYTAIGSDPDEVDALETAAQAALRA